MDLKSCTKLQSMTTLEIDCPVCDEVLELLEEDRADLHVEDIIVCDSCNAEMIVTRNDGGEAFELELLDIMTSCPNCEEEFAVTDQMISSAAQDNQGIMISVVSCPHCKAQIELEFEDEVIE